MAVLSLIVQALKNPSQKFKKKIVYRSYESPRKPGMQNYLVRVDYSRIQSGKSTVDCQFLFQQNPGGILQILVSDHLNCFC